MVSSSRKKNRGKERKAKKVEAERASVRSTWLGWATTGECNHVCVQIPEVDHPVSSFMNDFMTNWSQSEGDIEKIIIPLLETQQQVWNDDGYMQEKVINILTRMGTNFLLMSDKDDTIFVGVTSLAKAIVIFEHYDGSFDAASRSPIVQAKMRDLNSTASSIGRDVLKFFSKRVSCSCLKEMHNKARNCISKMGLCYHCNEEKDRVALSVCSRCKIIQYCSRECQVADWHEHVSYCDQYVNAQNRQTQVKSAEEHENDFMQQRIHQRDMMRDRIQQNSMQLSKFEQQEGLNQL